MNTPNHVYCCAECGEVVKKQVKPNMNNCPGSSFHRWINIGNEGKEEYKCLNCNVIVHTAKHPNSYGCKKSVFHDWKSVGI